MNIRNIFDYMGLNTVLIISMFLSGIQTHFAAFLAYKHAKKIGNKNLMLLVYNWLIFGATWYFLAWGHVTYNVIFHQIAYIMQILALFFLLLFTDLNTRINLNPKNLVIFASLSTLYIIAIFLPNQYQIEPGYGLHFVGYLRIMQMAIGGYYSYISFVWIMRIWRALPPKPKKIYGIKLITIAVIMDIIPLVIYFFATVVLWLGVMPFVVQAIGEILLILLIIKEPKLLHILSFHCHRMVIISRRSGLQLYEYKWTNKKFGDLLSSLMYAIVTISNNVLSSGELDELRLRNGHIIFHHESLVSIALLANRNSHYLRNCLSEFTREANRVLEQADFNEDQGICMDDLNFLPALIEKHFNGIPNWVI